MFFTRLEQSRQRLAARQYTRDSDGQFASTGGGDGGDDDFEDDFEDDDGPDEVNTEFDNDKLSADFKARYGEVVMEGDAGDGHRVVLTDKNGIHIVDDRGGLGQRKVAADLNGPTAAYLHEVARDAWESDTATSEPVGEGKSALTVHGDGEGAITIDWPGGGRSTLPNAGADVEDFVTGVEAVVNQWWRSRPRNRAPRWAVRHPTSRRGTP